MKVIEFKTDELKFKEECIEAVKKYLEKCTQFVFIFSVNDLDNTHHIKMGLQNVEAIGMVDATKHKILHDVLSEDDDEPDEEDIPNEKFI